MGRVCSALVLGLVCGLPAIAIADPISITSDRRTVFMQGGASVGGTNIGDSAGATQRWSDTLSDSISIQAGPLTGSASGSLMSSISDSSRMSGTGRASASAVDPGPLGNSNSIGLFSAADFDVTFNLADFYRYSFASTFTSTSMLGPTGTQDLTPYFAQLAFFPGAPIFSINATDSNRFARTGILAPGGYSLIVESQAFVGGSASANSGFDFTFNLDPENASPTPEPASLLLLGSALGLSAMRRKGARRTERVLSVASPEFAVSASRVPERRT